MLEFKRGFPCSAADFVRAAVSFGVRAARRTFGVRAARRTFGVRAARRTLGVASCGARCAPQLRRRILSSEGVACHAAVRSMLEFKRGFACSAADFVRAAEGSAGA